MTTPHDHLNTSQSTAVFDVSALDLEIPSSESSSARGYDEHRAARESTRRRYVLSGPTLQDGQEYRYVMH